MDLLLKFHDFEVLQLFYLLKLLQFHHLHRPLRQLQKNLRKDPDFHKKHMHPEKLDLKFCQV